MILIAVISDRQTDRHPAHGTGWSVREIN